jgi:microcystin-dependent protein
MTTPPKLYVAQMTDPYLRQSMQNLQDYFAAPVAGSVASPVAGSVAATPAPAAQAVPNVYSPPVGSLLEVLSATPPPGYLALNGQQVSQTTYAALYKLWSGQGLSFGTAVTGSFCLPNWSRCVSVGSGGTGTAILDSKVGSTGGSETHALTIAELATHTHSNTEYGNSAGTNVGWNQIYNLVQGVIGSVVTSSTGSGTAHTIMQPSFVVLKCVKY